MIFRFALTTVVLTTSLYAQAPAAIQPRPKFDTFEVATIKPIDPELKDGRYIKMLTNNRFVAKAYTVDLLIAAAYDLNPKTISGGPSWLDSDHFDIQAVTPGDVRPTHEEQMAMLRSLLVERFQLRFHREQKEYSIYAIDVANGGPKLKPTTLAADAPVVIGPGVVYPQRVVLPARNATIGGLASILQRAILDRPVVDRTGLTGRYDFDLEWAPDETQFGGGVAPASDTAPAAPLFTAIQQQLGLTLKPTRGPVSALIVDAAQRPTAN